MSIKHYGLDAAEIEALEAQGKTDDEINAANRERVKAQMDAEDKGMETEMVEGVECLKGSDIPVDSWYAQMKLGKAEDIDDNGADDKELLKDDTPTNPEIKAIWDEMVAEFDSKHPSTDEEIEKIAAPFKSKIEDKARELSSCGVATGPLGINIGYRIRAKM